MEFVGESVREKLLFCGNNVKLNDLCKICKPEVVEIADNCRICDFVFIWGGRGCKIGKYTDVQPGVKIWGGGTAIIGDYVSIGLGSVLLTATYEYRGGFRMVDGVEENTTNAQYGTLKIENDVYIGANCTVMPNIVLGSGSILGANSLATKSLDPWGIYVGSPAKKVGERPRLVV